jgi:hypothetical protein
MITECIFPVEWTRMFGNHLKVMKVNEELFAWLVDRRWYRKLLNRNYWTHQFEFDEVIRCNWWVLSGIV